LQKESFTKSYANMDQNSFVKYVIYLKDIRRSIMSRQVTFDYSKAGSFISEEEIGYMKKLTLDAKETLVSKTGAGNDFLGWIDLPVDYDKEEFARIKAAAKKIQSDSDVLLVIGIGGSYLGAVLLLRVRMWCQRIPVGRKSFQPARCRELQEEHVRSAWQAWL
jgi:hypothetical protein